jgi:hypothetical protein
MIRPAPLRRSPSERLGGLACRVALATALAAPLTALATSVANGRFEIEAQVAGAWLLYPPPDEPAGTAGSFTTDHAPAGSSAEISPAAAVVESEAYALLLAGLSAAGFIAHRRRRT